MREMLLLGAWNCQVKYFYVHKSTLTVLMIPGLNYWRVHAAIPLKATCPDRTHVDRSGVGELQFMRRTVCTT